MSDKLMIPDDLLEMRFHAYTMHNEEGNCITLAESEWKRILARAEARCAELEATAKHGEKMYIAMRNRCARVEKDLQTAEAALERMRAPVRAERNEVLTKRMLTNMVRSLRRLHIAIKSCAHIGFQESSPITNAEHASVWNSLNEAQKDAEAKLKGYELYCKAIAARTAAPERVEDAEQGA